MTRRAAYHHGDLAAAAVEEALRLIAAEPAASFSLRSLAERLGVAHRALYNHFATRDTLLASVAARGFDRLADTLRQAPDPARFLAAYVRFALAEPGLYDVMTQRDYAQINAHPGLRSAVDRVIAVALAVLATPGAEEDTRRREVMRVWMLAHGGIGLQRAGMLRLRSGDEFAEEILRIAGLGSKEETKR
ncbi:TetR/AcrR family transcriptional regulator [Erythrobacter sp. NE805]|uniref:TetR/AcrR family transcriptional regulator n=1 Tax=Erythrobacter sp. NE805 TaxID=3389875 RepID=UPI00396B354B